MIWTLICVVLMVLLFWGLVAGLRWLGLGGSE